jgi:hypothetical protein
MIHWWGRLVYSLVSVALAAVLSVGLMMLAGSFPSYSGRDGLVGTLSVGVVSAFIGLVFTFSLPGWLLGLPFVLAVKDLRAWRFWLWLAIGTCIGPLLIVGWVLLEAPGYPHDKVSEALYGAMFFVYMATGVSSLTALIYLLLLRWAQKQERKRHVVIEGGAGNSGL